MSPPSQPSPATAPTLPAQEPDVVRLPPRPGVTPSAKPPVRLFLGTEEAQWRAERKWIGHLQG